LTKGLLNATVCRLLVVSMIVLNFSLYPDEKGNIDVAQFLENIRQILKKIQQLQSLKKSKDKSKKAQIRKSIIDKLSNPYSRLKQHKINVAPPPSESLNSETLKSEKQQSTAIVKKFIQDAAKNTFKSNSYLLPLVSDLNKILKEIVPKGNTTSKKGDFNDPNTPTIVNEKFSDFMQKFEVWFGGVSEIVRSFWITYFNFFIAHKKRNLYARYKLCKDDYFSIVAPFSLQSFAPADIFSPVAIGKFSALQCKLKEVGSNYPICHSLRMLDFFGDCAIRKVYIDIRETYKKCSSLKNSTGECPKLSLLVWKILRAVKEYIKVMNRIFVNKLLPEIFNVCYKECLCEDLNIKCGQGKKVEEIKYDTITILYMMAYAPAVLDKLKVIEELYNVSNPLVDKTKCDSDLEKPLATVLELIEEMFEGKNKDDELVKI
jgi:hypothetical protein